VTSDQLANGAVTTNAIFDGTIDTADLAAFAIKAPKIADKAVVNRTIDDLAVTADSPSIPAR
jgi:hypothetical protein